MSLLPKLQSNFSADCVVFGFDKGVLNVLLIERAEEPHKYQNALPGHLVHENESIETAANRILFELTGLSNILMEQFYTFGGIDRHPQGRVITVAYFALIEITTLNPISQSGYASSAKWVSVKDIPPLAFDHNQIIDTAQRYLKQKVKHEPVLFELLPEKFTIPQLQRVYDTILETQSDKRNFRKKMLKSNFLVELPETQQNASRRAAKLFSFNKNYLNEN